MRNAEATVAAVNTWGRVSRNMIATVGSLWGFLAETIILILKATC